MNEITEYIAEFIKKHTEPLEERIKELEMLLAEKEKRIMRLEAALREKDKKIERLESEVYELKTGERLTKPVIKKQDEDDPIAFILNRG